MKFRYEIVELSFYEWLVIAEGVDANIGEWIKAIFQYARPEERALLDALIDAGFLQTAEGGDYKLKSGYDTIVRAVLKERRKEDMNWLSFSLGYLSTKAFRKEDLEMAVDYLERMKSSGHVTRVEMGRLGWMRIGASMEDRISEYKRQTQQISKTQSRKMAKRGEVASEDAHLVSHVASEGFFDLYYVKSVRKEEDITARHRVLCKYGKGTKWCTADPTGTYHRHYASVGIFILHKGGLPKYQFVNCNDAPESDRDEDEDDDEGSIVQFMDVEDKPVESLTPAEQKFLKRHANLQCYDLVAEGFEDWEDFMAHSDDRVRESSGKVASEVLVMSGDKIAAAMIRLGPALSRMRSHQVNHVVSSDTWGPGVADLALDALAGPLRPELERERTNPWRSSVAEGLTGLMLRALASSTDPASKARGLADFLGETAINFIFRIGKLESGDDFLRAVVSNKKELDGEDMSSVVGNSEDLVGMLGFVRNRLTNKFFSEGTMSHLIEKMRKRNDGSDGALSKFIEDNLFRLPVEAAKWAILSSPDKEAATKRILSMNLDDERIRDIFRMRDVYHLADDRHIKIMAKKTKEGRDMISLVGSFNDGRSTGEKIDRVIRTLNNSEELEGKEVKEIIRSWSKSGQDGADELVRRLPQEFIDLLSDADLEDIAKVAEKSCEATYRSSEKPREDCFAGRPLVVLLQRMDRRFPMEYAAFMKKGEERDELIIGNIEGADQREVRRAMDLAFDKDAVADAAVDARGEDITPGEIAVIVGYGTDKRRFLRTFADRIDSLGEAFESENEVSSERNEDWMDALMGFKGSEEILDDVLAIYKRPFRPKAIESIIRAPQDREAKVEKIKESIVGLSDKDYIRLHTMMKNWTFREEFDKTIKNAIELVDEARNGGPMAKGQTVVAIRQPRLQVYSIPAGENAWLLNKIVEPSERTLAAYQFNRSKDDMVSYSVRGIDGEVLVLSPITKFDANVSGHKKSLNDEWSFLSYKKYFIRLKDSENQSAQSEA